MTVEREICDAPYTADNVKAEADIRHIHAVHHVKVQDICTGGLGSLYFIFKVQHI